MFLKAGILSAEATADGLKHFRLITSVHLYSLQFNFRFAEKGWFLDTTDSGKIAYTTNQNREMKKK